MFVTVDVVVLGALDQSETFYDYALYGEFLNQLKTEARLHGERIEVYVTEHEHDSEEECECTQYQLSHNPTYVYNVE